MDTVVPTATATLNNYTGRSDQRKDGQTKNPRQSLENGGLPLVRQHSCWQGNLTVNGRFSLNDAVYERHQARSADYRGEPKGQKTGSPGSVLSGFPTALIRPTSPHRRHEADGRARSSGRNFWASATPPLLPRLVEDGRVSDPGNLRECPPIRDCLPIVRLAMPFRNIFLTLC